MKTTSITTAMNPQLLTVIDSSKTNINAQPAIFLPKKLVYVQNNSLTNLIPMKTKTLSTRLNQVFHSLINGSTSETTVQSFDQFSELPNNNTNSGDSSDSYHFDPDGDENIPSSEMIRVCESDDTTLELSQPKVRVNSKKSVVSFNHVVRTIDIENLIQHPYHQKVYKSRSAVYMESSIERTGDAPIYPIVAVPHQFQYGQFWVISGMVRLDALIQLGYAKVKVMVYEIKDEPSIKNLIIDLNKSRVKDGHELLMEFRHYLELHPQRKGVKGSRYDLIGNEMNLSYDRVKDLSILNTFFIGEGDIILESVFGGVLSVNQSNNLKRVVELFPEKFNSEVTYDKFCNGDYDFTRLEYAVRNLSIEDEDDFDLMKSYLLKEFTTPEFHKILEQKGKVEKVVNGHELSKVLVPALTDEFTTDHTHIIQGDNMIVPFNNPFGKKIKCLVGSPPYGDRRLNGDDADSDTGHGMSGQEYGEFLAQTYERYIEHMDPEGSVYVIIDDYKQEDGELACSLEFFVTEMLKKGFFLVSRYVWVKSNAMPRNYKGKVMTNSIEMVYRFTLDRKNYYSNPNLFMETELPDGKKMTIKKGCTNHGKDGKTSKGGTYVQSHLKKLRNTLSEQDCIGVIRGNVANPENFFRQVDEKRHTSTAPIYLTSVLILESTQKGDLVADIWNGVANTGISSLLLQRPYVGVEKEENYYQQSCRRLQMTEDMLMDVDMEEMSYDNKIAA